MTHAEFLSVSAIEARRVALPASELIYEDDLSLTDLAIAPSGAICCLRRKPHQADVLVWTDGNFNLTPIPWTENLGLDLLNVVYFDGTRLCANTGRELVLITRGTVQVLFQSKTPIVIASLSPDQTYVAWIERGRRWVGMTAPIQSPERSSVIPLKGDCHNVIWVDRARLLVRETRRHPESEEIAVLMYDVDEEKAQPLFSTQRVVHFLGVDGANHVFVGGGGLTADRRGLAPRGTWVVNTNREKRQQAVCIANEAPGGSALLMPDGLVFAGFDATTEGSSLFSASEGGCIVARVGHFVRDFVVTTPRTMLFREFGSRGGIRRQPIDALLAA